MRKEVERAGNGIAGEDCMSLHQKKNTKIEGEYVTYNTDTADTSCIIMQVVKVDTTQKHFRSLDTARAIHAELTELFKLLDEKA